MRLRLRDPGQIKIKIKKNFGRRAYNLVLI